MKTVTFVCALALWCANLKGDLEITVSSTALERLVSRTLFKEEGRLYIQGSPDSPCYLFLEDPRIRIEPPHVVFAAHLTGRVGLPVSGGCVGVGESLDIALTALPFVQGSRVGLREIEIAADRYQPLIRAALRLGDARSFDADFADVLAKLLSSAELQPYGLTLTSIAFGKLSVQPGRLRLGFDARIGSPP